MYRESHEHRVKGSICNQVSCTHHSPDTKSSFLKKQAQLAMLVYCWGGPPPLQVLDVDCARGPGQHQGHKTTTGLLRFPHDSHSHKLIWRDGLLGHRTQVILKKIPDIDPRRIVLDQEHCRPCWGPLQTSNSMATGAVVPLHDGPLRRQLVQPDASI